MINEFIVDISIYQILWTMMIELIIIDSKVTKAGWCKSKV